MLQLGENLLTMHAAAAEPQQPNCGEVFLLCGNYLLQFSNLESIVDTPFTGQSIIINNNAAEHQPLPTDIFL